MKVGYLKFSPLETDELEQVKDFQDELGLDKVFWERLSIKSSTEDMKEYQRMLRYMEEGDVLIVPEFAKLSKNVGELLKFLERLKEKGITLISHRENFNSASDEGKLLMKSMLVLADFDERVLLQRRREGIAKAKAEGKYKGGGRLIKRPEDFGDFVQMYRTKKMTVTAIAKHYNVSRVTVYKWIKESAKDNHDKIV